MFGSIQRNLRLGAVLLGRNRIDAEALEKDGLIRTEEMSAKEFVSRMSRGDFFNPRKLGGGISTGSDRLEVISTPPTIIWRSMLLGAKRI